MKLKSTVNAQETRRAIPMVMAVGLAATLALGVPRGATAQDAQDTEGKEHRRVCSNATLRGDYGRISSGIRVAPVNPALTEMFAATGVRTYDGHGGFTGVSSSHGQISPPNRNTPETGTYQVNADCTGTALILITGAPFPIENAFVIVDGGKQINHAVLSPQPQVVTSIEHRVR